MANAFPDLRNALFRAFAVQLENGRKKGKVYLHLCVLLIYCPLKLNVVDEYIYISLSLSFS